LKTSSGKIRRAACRELYERGGPAPGRAPAWWQQARSFWLGARPRLQRQARQIADTFWVGWAWTWFVLLSAITWPVSVLLPRPAW
ncbi:MAG: hypothetical protein N2689_16590, partial [Verrucomicrobiae bacterium]|nr:hypothetical protein [Verrucomicrobiae bacterium]